MGCMSCDAQYASEELDGKMRELLGLVENVKKAELLPQKKEQEIVARTQYKQVRSCINSFRAEVKRIEDPTQKSVFSRKLATFEEHLKTCDEELKLQLRPAGKAPCATKEKPAAETECLTTKQVMEVGRRLQQDSLESLRRCEQLLDTSEEVGRGALNQLERQGATIRQTNDVLDTQSAHLHLAKKDVMWHARH